MPINRRRLLRGTIALATLACGEDPNAPVDAPPAVAQLIGTRATTVGSPVNIDVTAGFTDRRRGGLTYAATFFPASAGLTLVNGRLTGTPAAPTVVMTRVIATDVAGDTASQLVNVVAFAEGLTSPTLPPSPFPYSDARRPIPRQYVNGNAPGGSALALSNAPPNNPTTDAGATLGRVLFYDTRLSRTDRVACASCHVRQFGFGDTARFSAGVAGRTARHSMGLANARFYANGRFFWDQRALSLEDQTLRPIQDVVEMGLPLAQLEVKLAATPYYPALFEAAFGTRQITSVLVSRALAQYVRSIVSYGSRFDSTFANAGPNPPPGPNLALLTAEEQQGFNLFNQTGRCAQCHATNAHVSDNIHNTGLDSAITDQGAGGGRFKAPSLRNVGARGRFMHDGRFTSLEQVVDFYNSGVQRNPQLDGRMRDSTGAPRRLGLTVTQRDALVAFLKTLTDNALMQDGRFSNPFP